MKNIKNTTIINKAKELIIKANFQLPGDILASLKKAYEKETSPNARIALDMIIKNADIAAREKLPLCQDCGNVYIDIEVGKGHCIQDPVSLEEGLQEIISQAYRENSLRPSIVEDPLYLRKNTLDNTPGIIEIRGIAAEGIKISVYLKGGGSENCSYLMMENPQLSEDELVDKVYRRVSSAVTKCCPPVIVGIGIGASASQVLKIARKASFRELDKKNSDKRYLRLERKILEKINSSGIGVQGLGGDNTALACNIDFRPCHMATLPVGISLGCHSTRRAKASLY